MSCLQAACGVLILLRVMYVSVYGQSTYTCLANCIANVNACPLLSLKIYDAPSDSEMLLAILDQMSSCT